MTYNLIAERNGARLIIVNRESTEFDDIADLARESGRRPDHKGRADRQTDCRRTQDQDATLVAVERLRGKAADTASKAASPVACAFGKPWMGWSPELR
jgi:hypothetical protein